MCAQEGECFAAAANLDTHKALVHIFFAQRDTKKIKGVTDAGTCFGLTLCMASEVHRVRTFRQALNLSFLTSYCVCVMSAWPISVAYLWLMADADLFSPCLMCCVVTRKHLHPLVGVALCTFPI